MPQVFTKKINFQMPRKGQKPVILQLKIDVTRWTKHLKFFDDIIPVPAVEELLFISVIPLQLLAYHIAAPKADVDQPRVLEIRPVE